MSVSIIGTHGISTVVAIVGKSSGGFFHIGNGALAGKKSSESITAQMDGIVTNIIHIIVRVVDMYMLKADGYIEERFAFPEDILTMIWVPILSEDEGSAPLGIERLQVLARHTELVIRHIEHRAATIGIGKNRLLHRVHIVALIRHLIEAITLHQVATGLASALIRHHRRAGREIRIGFHRVRITAVLIRRNRAADIEQNKSRNF